MKIDKVSGWKFGRTGNCWTYITRCLISTGCGVLCEKKRLLNGSSSKVQRHIHITKGASLLIAI